MIDTSACMLLSPRPKILAILLALVACGAEDPLRPGVAPRHLVLITVEGMRADHSSAYLYGRRTTSFEIDAGGLEQGRALTPDHLAEGGVLFRNASAPADQAYLSLGALLAGARPLEFGRLDVVDSLTLAESFEQKGFHCAAFVSPSWHGDVPAQGVLRGFHSYEEGENDLAAMGSAVSFMAEHDWGNQQGVFLWLHLSGPTFPFEPPTFPQNYHGDKPVDYATLFGDPDYAGKIKDPLTLDKLYGPTLTPADLDELEALYDGELAYASYLIWLTLDLLRYFSETEDAMADTVLCIAGVNGMPLFEELAGLEQAKGPSDAHLGVPLLLHHPASLTGRRVLESQVTLEDLPRTFADWFDLEGRENLRGRSLLALTDREPRESFEERASCSYYASSDEVSARGPVWRLTVWRDALGAPGAPMPSSARIEPVMGLRRLPVDPDGSAALGLLEELRAWVASQRESQ